MKKSNGKNIKRIIILLTIVVIITLCYAKMSSYYPVDSWTQDMLTDSAIEEYESSTGIDVIIEKKEIILMPDNATTGIIMYPGAKVPNEAYYPMFQKIAEAGNMSVLLRISEAEAFFSMDEAQGICDKYPQIKHWYLAGHSLGGVVSSLILSEHLDEYDGIIFLASYPSKSIIRENSQMKVLSIYGSEDKILGLNKYREEMKKNTAGFEEYIIQGGCHAGFAAYGPQKGDGNPYISTQEQMEHTAILINDFINGVYGFNGS